MNWLHVDSSWCFRPVLPHRSLLHYAWSLDPLCRLCSVITTEAVRVGLKAASYEMLPSTKGMEIPGLFPCNTAAKLSSDVTSPLFT